MIEHPLFIFDALDSALEWAMGGGGRTTIVLVLLIAVVYFRKALGLGSILADWVGRVIFTLVVFVLLLVTGIVPGVNLDAAMDLLNTALDLFEVVLEVVA